MNIRKPWWAVTALILLAIACLSVPDPGPPVIPPAAATLGATLGQDGVPTCTGPNQHLDPSNPCRIEVDAGSTRSWWTAKTDMGAEFLGCVQTTNDFVAWTCGVKWPALPGHDYDITPFVQGVGHEANVAGTEHAGLLGAPQSDWADTAECSKIGALCTTLRADTDLGHQYLGCLNNTPSSTAWACWFKYPAVVDRDYRYEG